MPWPTVGFFAKANRSFHLLTPIYHKKRHRFNAAKSGCVIAHARIVPGNGQVESLHFQPVGAIAGLQCLLSTTPIGNSDGSLGIVVFQVLVFLYFSSIGIALAYTGQRALETLTQTIQEIITMMKRIVCVFGVVACSLASAPVFADSLMGLDQNQDGFVSMDEAKSMPDLAKAFMELDGNGDGQLDAQEIAAFVKG